MNDKHPGNATIHPSVRSGLDAMLKADASMRRRQSEEAEAVRKRDQERRDRDAENMKRTIAFLRG